MLISSNGNELCRVTCCKQWQPLLLIDLKGSHVDYNTITQLVQQSKRDIEQKKQIFNRTHTHMYCWKTFLFWNQVQIKTFNGLNNNTAYTYPQSPKGVFDSYLVGVSIKKSQCGSIVISISICQLFKSNKNQSIEYW